MENASKALIMAAEILIGVMVISIGVYLWTTLGNYSAETTAQIAETQLEQFNNQFLKYYGTVTTDSGISSIKCTIHDIVGLANLANRINESNGFTEEGETYSISNSSYYIQIDVKIGTTTYRLENKSQSDLIELIKENDILVTTDSSGHKETNVMYFKATGYSIRSKYSEELIIWNSNMMIVYS